MKKLFGLLATASLFFSASVFAQDIYEVPAGLKQYSQCVVTANKKWTGGNDRSKIKGQTNAQAYCACLWNETPDDFQGGLANFSDTPKGKAVRKICEKYSGWAE